MDIRFYNEIESNPIIAAVKDMDGLHKAVKIDSIRIIFILFGETKLKKIIKLQWYILI